MANDTIKERILVSLTSVFVVVSLYPAEAQQTAKTMPRIGFISPTGAPRSGSPPSPLFQAFRLGLRDLGYVDGKNVVIVHRYAEGRLDRIPALVHGFVQQKIDAIVAGNNVAIRAAKKATKTIPVIMLCSINPVTAGYVESFARPGGNITGLTTISREISAKRVELLKDLLPKLSRVGVLWDADGPGPAIAIKQYKEAVRAFKLELRSLAIQGPNPDITGAFQAAKTARLDALIIVGNPLMAQHRKQVLQLATKNHLPSMTERSRYVKAGGLVSYGANFADIYRRSAGYVVEILKGANPGDLPVKLPEKFEMFLNLKTARQLDLVIPKHVLIRADKVIQ